MDKISFKGYKNILQYRFADKTPPLLQTRIVAQVTNEGSQDLKKWLSLSVRKKLLSDGVCEQEKFIKLDLLCKDFFISEDGNVQVPFNTSEQILLNGEEIKICDKNIPIITQLANFLKQVTNSLKNNEENYDDNYIMSLYHLLEKTLGQEIHVGSFANQIVDVASNPQEISITAGGINEGLKCKMSQYFDSDRT